MDRHPEGLLSPVLCPVSLWAQLMKEAGETPKTASFHDILTCPPRPRPSDHGPSLRCPASGTWFHLQPDLPSDSGELSACSPETRRAWLLHVGFSGPQPGVFWMPPPPPGRAGTWQGGLLGIPADPGLQLLLASLPSLLWPTRGQAILAPTGLPVQGPVTICQASSL